MRALLPVFLLLALLAPGAAGASSVAGAWLSPVALHDPADPLSLAEPESLLLLVYSHGSRAEFRGDRCRPLGETTPEAVRRLAGARLGGLRVAVFAFCTRARHGSFQAESGRGEPKVAERTREIAALARRFAEAGVPARRIVLVGQSAGGWASLLAAARAEPPLGGVIAFAPAFAGPAAGRAPAWQALRDAQAGELAAAARLEGLVYAFPGDPYEPPADLGFLAALPGVELRSGAADPACAPREPHLSAFADCFAEAERERLLGFLAGRARPAGGA